MISKSARQTLSIAGGLLLSSLSVLTSPVSAQTLQFGTHKDYSTGYGPGSIAVGDLNGDGRVDLAVADAFSDQVAVLLGNADGSFQPPTLIYLGPSNNPRSIAIGDVNRDGKPDLVVANAVANTVALIRGNGDGTFQPAVTIAAPGSPVSLALADFNGDGNPDLALANSAAGNVSVLLGNGDGTFQAARILQADLGPAFVAAADLNRDGKPDLVVANNGSGTVSVLLGVGDGSFQAARTFASGAGTSSIGIGDFNNDGVPDVAATNNGANSVAVLLGSGDGTLQAARSFTIGNGPNSVAVGDFNRDGRADVAVASYQPATSSGKYLSVALGNGDGTFQTPQTFAAGVESFAVTAADFNADGVTDLAIANSFSTTVSILLGKGDGTFPAAASYATGRDPESVVVADFNRDGKLDVATANAGSNTVSILLGNGNGTFQNPVSFPAGRGPTSIALGDFNRDGITDLVVSNYGTADYYNDTFVLSTVSVLLGNGDGTFQPPLAFEAGLGPNDVAVGDFNGDGIQDLAVADYGPGSTRGTTVSVLLGNGDGTFRAPLANTVGNAPSCVAIGDFNRDGRLDLAVCNYSNNNVSILLGAGDGTFQPAGTIAVGTAPWKIVVVDFDGDHNPDLVVGSHWSDIISIVRGNGDGTFQPHVWYRTDRGPTGIAVADFNGDGIADVAVANYFSTTVSILLGNSNGTLQPSREFAVDLAPMGIAAADFNGDGQPDLAVANYFGFSLSILLNKTFLPRVATPTIAPASGTFVNSVVVSIADATAGAAIYYTTDGSTPTSASLPYAGPIVISKSATVNAIASAPDMRDSNVASAAFTIQASAPAISPAAGTYVGSVSVSLSTTTSGATIRYTTDGTAPTASSPAYTAPITLARTTTVRAIATASGMSNSVETSAAYTIRAVPPTFSPSAGTYNQPQTVALSSSTSGAAIYYTTDGSTPTTASTPYTGPISVTRSTTIRAIATASGLADSTVATAAYTLQAAMPTFDPPGGSYLLPQSVSISDASPGVTIYYTTDGSTPTTSSTRYTGSFLVLIGTTTVKAIAVAPGWSQSAVAIATYSIPF